MDQLSQFLNSAFEDLFEIFMHGKCCRSNTNFAYALNQDAADLFGRSV
jgi:hypothetical protein